MAGSVNKCIILGNVGQDPQIRTTQDGKEIASLSIATSESWKSKDTGEKQTRTEWHRISCFNDNLTNVIKQYVKKGDKLYIEGAIQTRKYTDKDGAEKYSTEIVLQAYNGTLVMLGGKRDGDVGEQQESMPLPKPKAAAKTTKQVADDFGDSIPF